MIMETAGEKVLFTGVLIRNRNGNLPEHYTCLRKR